MLVAFGTAKFCVRRPAFFSVAGGVPSLIPTEILLQHHKAYRSTLFIKTYFEPLIDLIFYGLIGICRT